MQNKTKLFLVIAAVLLGGFSVGNYAKAADQCTLNGGVCVSCPVSCANACADNGYENNSKLASYNNDCSLAVNGVCCAKSIVPPASDCVCGGSDRQSFPSAPTSNLCQTGTASDIYGTGPWTWQCGDSCKTVNCSAIKSSTATTNCVCGSAKDQIFSTAPTGNLCQTGTASDIYGTGPWTWQCGGTCGTVSCSTKASGTTSCADLVNGAACTTSDGQVGVCSGGACSTGTKATSCADLVDGAACTTSDGKSGACKNGACSTGTATSPGTTPGAGITFPTDTGLPTNTNLVKGIFTNVANFLLSIIGIIAIISFVISGIQYFLVATDEKMMETAKKTMVASIIGLVVALFGYIAVKTVEMLLKG
jgi:hypothetical protein